MTFDRLRYVHLSHWRFILHVAWVLFTSFVSRHRNQQNRQELISQLLSVAAIFNNWLILTLVAWILDSFMFSSCVKVHSQLSVKSLITFLTIVYLLTWMFIYFEFLQISLIWYEILTLVTYIYSLTFMSGFFVLLRFYLFEDRYSHRSHEDYKFHSWFPCVP